jgi:hypothetical protein
MVGHVIGEVLDRQLFPEIVGCRRQPPPKLFRDKDFGNSLWKLNSRSHDILASNKTELGKRFFFWPESGSDAS